MSAEFSTLLQSAITEPGIISEAYSRFHRFSIGNQILAAIQLAEKGLPISPIASFTAWKTAGRSVKKGEKALSLWQPISAKKKDEETGDETAYTFFKLSPRWFSLDQTDGEEYSEPVETPAWNAEAALAALDITSDHFSLTNGNVQGYAVKRRIAINPLAQYAHKTRFHEIAHIVLGHTASGDCQDAEEVSRDIKEVEAESVAYLLCSILDLPGKEESRGYIQSWLDGQKLPEKSAQRIFKAAQQIMEAGSKKSKE